MVDYGGLWCSWLCFNAIIWSGQSERRKKVVVGGLFLAVKKMFGRLKCSCSCRKNLKSHQGPMPRARNLFEYILNKTSQNSEPRVERESVFHTWSWSSSVGTNQKRSEQEAGSFTLKCAARPKDGQQEMKNILQFEEKARKPQVH